MDSSEFSCISWGMHTCILKQSAYFVPCPHYHASNECVWRSKGRDTKKCISCHGHIPSIIFHAICGAVCNQRTHLSYDDCENTCTLFYYHHRIESMICHCYGVGHETKICALCLYTFFRQNGLRQRAVWIGGQNCFVCNSWFFNIYLHLIISDTLLFWRRKWHFPPPLTRDKNAPDRLQNITTY